MLGEVFIRQVEDSQRWLRRFLASLCCGDNFLTDEIAQETYIRAYLAIQGGSTYENFKPWILKIAYNTFVNYKRSRKNIVGEEPLTNFESEYKADASFKYERLYKALERLPLKERTSTVLFYMEGYSTKEIATIMEISEDSVRQALSRGRKRLKELL